MHPDELDVDVPLVRRLLAAQFPQWADLRLEPVESAGTDNAIFRLGDDMAVRIPRIRSATRDIDKQREWLPRLAPHLPLTVTLPLATGSPGDRYPWPWSIAQWVEGEPATAESVRDLGRAATDLAAFVVALQRIDPTGAPPSARGRPLAPRDEPTRAAVAQLHGKLDTRAVTAAWEAALQAPPWPGPPLWVHGDLYDGNLLAANGRLSAVIDWSIMGVGDPACDLVVAWSLFSGESRGAFREALSVDEATWARGRGWALSSGLIALPYYEHTNSVMIANAMRRIEEVLTEHGNPAQA
jgi:aminoglycoside phosphotransferase (APT) family kinase protein